MAEWYRAKTGVPRVAGSIPAGGQKFFFGFKLKDTYALCTFDDFFFSDMPNLHIDA